MQKILLIDNYDSFVYNLVHYLEDLNCEVSVRFNDQITLEEVEQFQKIVLSPGPGIPDEAGLLKPIIRKFGTTKSILGVCLGQQAIAEVYGGKLKNLEEVYHGVSTDVIQTTSNSILFKGFEKTFQVGRYHSWVVDSIDLPDCLEVTSRDENGFIMSLRHKSYDVRSVQFHPESILTPKGKQILKNWLQK